MAQSKDVKTLTKADIHTNLYKKVGYSRKCAYDFVNSVFDIICDRLCSGYNMKLSGFGNFMLRDKKMRVGRDLKTGKQITIKKKRVVVFYPSALLKERVDR